MAFWLGGLAICLASAWMLSSQIAPIAQPADPRESRRTALLNRLHEKHKNTSYTFDLHMRHESTDPNETDSLLSVFGPSSLDEALEIEDSLKTILRGQEVAPCEVWYTESSSSGSHQAVRVITVRAEPEGD